MTVDTTGFESLHDHTFHEVFDAEIDNVGVLEAVIREASRRSDIRSEEVDRLLRAFVRHSLRDIWNTYEDLFSLFWDDRDAARREYLGYALGCIFNDDGNEPEWPWPITEPPENKGGSLDETMFKNKHSGLWICGYRTGKTYGMPDAERQRLLDYFFRNRLPEAVARYHGTEYGDPGSEERLRKMANVLASNCRNFKRNDRRKYRVAIAHLEQDLNHLREKYYRAGMFPWPPIEP
jgi:hypothetical protein